MKMIRSIFAVTIFLLVNAVSAQTNVLVSGHLTDISTSTPVPNHYVSVFVHPYSLGVAPYYADSVLTNSAGSYSFDFMLPTPVDSLFVLKVGTFECNGNWAHETFDNINGQTNFSADLYICDSIYQFPDCYCAIEGFGPGVENLTVYLHGYTWPTADSYNWDLGDGTYATGQDVIHTYSSPQRYTIGLTTTNFPDSCSYNAIATVDLSLSSDCESSFTTTPGDDLYSLYFHPTTTSQYPTGYTWSFGDGTSGSGQFISHTYGSFGTYLVTLTAIDNIGCTFIYTSSVIVSDSINPNGCDNYIDVLELVEHTVSLSGGVYSGQTASYFWDLGDGNTSTEQTFSHTYEYPGYHTISLETYTNDSCYDQTERTIFFTDSAYLDYTCGYTMTAGNDPLTKNFQAITTSLYPTLFTWSFSDGTEDIGPNISHTFGNYGNYDVKVHCRDSAGRICTFEDGIVVGDSVNPSNCENWINILGIAGHTINLYPVMVNGQLKTAFWDMGDGTTSSAFEVTHTYALAGFYTVTLQTLTWNGCTDQSSIVIHITDSIPNDCTSHFTAKATNNLYEIHFTGYTSSQYSASYMWNFGDPASGTNNMSTSQNPNHTFSAAGTYSVTLSIVDSTNCTSTFSAPVILSLFSNYSLFGQIFAGNQSSTACKVQLFSQDYTGSMNMLEEVTPDSANYYKFDSVSSGIYHILAIPDPGTIYAQQYLPTYFGDAFLWENSTPVVLGQPVNPYLIHLVDFDSISGGDGLINGDLTSGGKSIIVGNQEILILDANNVPVKYMFSLPDGSFSFTGLPYGEYKVYPVITGIRTYPVTVILSESSKTATVVMKISGQSVAGIGDGNPMSSIEMLYPNPVINQLFMSLKSKGEVKIRITDMSGKTVMVKKEQSPASGNLLSLSVFEFEPGLYILIIQDENGYISSRRFIKN